jgi:uncharacterized protein YndB with AHSA1/START domain
VPDVLRGEASIFVDAPPERVWRLLSDVTRMGEWSPVTYKCEWIDGSTGPSVGARFKGYNKMRPARWWTTCEVTASEPGKLFEFRTIDGTFNIGSRGKENTRWRYTFEPDGIGTRITETYDVSFIPALLRIPEAIARKIPGGARAVDKRRAQTDRGMVETLERLKRVAEGE